MKNMLNKGEKHSLRVSGDVVKRVCTIFAACVGLMAAGWTRMLLFSVVFIGRRVEMIFPLSQSILILITIGIDSTCWYSVLPIAPLLCWHGILPQYFGANGKGKVEFGH
jgi:hypothetical protein